MEELYNRGQDLGSSWNSFRRKQDVEELDRGEGGEHCKRHAPSFPTTFL